MKSRLYVCKHLHFSFAKVSHTFAASFSRNLLYHLPLLLTHTGTYTLSFLSPIFTMHTCLYIYIYYVLFLSLSHSLSLSHCLSLPNLPRKTRPKPPAPIILCLVNSVGRISNRLCLEGVKSKSWSLLHVANQPTTAQAPVECRVCGSERTTSIYSWSLLAMIGELWSWPTMCTWLVIHGSLRSAPNALQPAIWFYPTYLDLTCVLTPILYKPPQQVRFQSTKFANFGQLWSALVMAKFANFGHDQIR